MIRATDTCISLFSSHVSVTHDSDIAFLSIIKQENNEWRIVKD